MKVISIINLKGGVGKTITAVNMAHILATEHNKRVLVMDADPQANASRFFGADTVPGLAMPELFNSEICPWDECVWQTNVAGVDIVPARIDLVGVDISSANDNSSTVNVLPEFCEEVRNADAYDFVIIDCPPGFTAVSVSALAASDDVIIPAKVDAFATTGIAELRTQIAAAKTVRSCISIAGVLITMWQPTPVIMQGESYLRSTGIPVFETYIRRTPEKVDESTFARVPLSRYSKYCSAARDYRAFVDEYFGRCE